MFTKTQPFAVSIPTTDGESISELVEIQIPMKWDDEIEEWIMTEEGLKKVEDTKAHFQDLKLRRQHPNNCNF